MDGIEIPQYFICPISLQIMKDPVTAITGITYDRESIEQWLKIAKDTTTTCPVTNQLLPADSDSLTPNHTLRRLIQKWLKENSRNIGADSLSKSHVLELVRELEVPCSDNITALKKMEVLAMDNDESCRKFIEEAGVAKAVISLMIRCCREGTINGVEEALRILYHIRTPSDEIKDPADENFDFIDCLTWILGVDIENLIAVKTHAMVILKRVTEVANTRLLQKLRPEFFKQMLMVMNSKISQQVTKSALQILLQVCQRGRNKSNIIESDAIFELIEFELQKPEKNITELIINLLANLCSCADGRAKFLSHSGSIAMAANRILRVSTATDDQAVQILSLISKYSPTKQVLQEMLRVGAVTKLCMVIQADCATYLKEKATRVLRLHANLWNDSPCIAILSVNQVPKVNLGNRKF